MVLAREVAWDRSRVGRAGVPKAIVTEGKSTLAMMEEVIARVDSAMKKVVANKGAPGPDGMTVSQLREQWPAIAPRLRADLLSGGHRPGGVRRVMIPKAGGGQRGLGIPTGGLGPGVAIRGGRAAGLGPAVRAFVSSQ